MSERESSIVLLHHHLAAIDDVQPLSWSIHSLTGNVVDHILACLGVGCDVADARSVGILNPVHFRLVALAATIIDALQTDLVPLLVVGLFQVDMRAVDFSVVSKAIGDSCNYKKLSECDTLIINF